MTQLRQAKIDKIADCIPALEVQGNPDADLLVVGFGGTYGHLYSAVEQMNEEGKKAALAHFEFINPLPKNTEEVLRKYKRIVVAEQNMGQFANPTGFYLGIYHLPLLLISLYALLSSRQLK